MAKNEDKGWIRLYRSLMDNPFWTNEPFTIGQAWVDLLLLANFAEREILFKGTVQKVERGQIVTSDRYLAERWHWSRDRVRRSIKLFESAQMLRVNRSRSNTTLTIENWGKYQDARSTSNTTNKTTDKTTNKTTGDTQYKNDKNEKNIKNVYSAPQETKEDYGNLWLTPTEYEQLEGICERVGASMTEYVDRVSDWLADNKADPKKHMTIFKTFLKNDGYI